MDAEIYLITGMWPAVEVDGSKCRIALGDSTSSSITNYYILSIQSHISITLFIR